MTRRGNAPGGPTIRATLRNRAAFERRAANALPDGLRIRRVEGVVVSLALIGRDGRMRGSLLAASGRSARLIAITQQLVRNADYEPMRVNGEPVLS